MHKTGIIKTKQPNYKNDNFKFASMCREDFENIYICFNDVLRSNVCLPGVLRFCDQEKIEGDHFPAVYVWDYFQKELSKTRKDYIQKILLTAKRRNNNEIKKGWCDLELHKAKDGRKIQKSHKKYEKNY